MGMGAALGKRSNSANGGEYDDTCPVEETLSPQILAEIFLRVNAPQTLIASCTLVCRRWAEVLSARGFWVRYVQCHQALDIPFSLRNEPLLDFKKIAVFRSFERNLIMNPSGENGFKGWTRTADGGDGWIVEKPPLGIRGITLEGASSAFATSYGWCGKHCDVVLQQFGIEPGFLDKYRPPITVSEHYTCRFDCACKYKFLAFLTPSSGVGREELVDELEPASTLKPDSITPISVEYYREMEQWADTTWRYVEHTFKDYPKGVGCIRIEHSGSDRQFWKGHYGSKIAKSSVVIHIGDGVPKEIN